jgi:hypothetical protein
MDHNMKTKMKTLSALALACGIAAASAQAAGFWQPLCPDGAVCATSSKAFVGAGKVLLQPADTERPSQWIDIATLNGVPTAMRDISVVTPAGNYLATSGPLTSKYDAAGNLLYTTSGGSIESWIVFESHAKQLGSLYYGGTSPATVINGLTLSGWTPMIYLTRDEGRTVVAQQASVPMDGERTTFVTSVDGQRVWAVPGPATPGLWQTPVATGAATPDFTQLTRVDDGTFPADVYELKAIAVNAALPGGYAIALAEDGMYVSTNLGRTWTRAAFDGVVDDVVFPMAGNADVQAIAARSTVLVSRDRGQTWSELGRGLPADRYLLSASNGNLVADGVGGVFACSALDCAGPAFGRLATAGAVSAQVTEFYNTVLDHFFMTADESEKAAIRSGAAGPGWVDTNQSFWAWSPTVTRESAFVCRFYGDLVKGPNSHFYSASTDECRSLLTLQDTLPANQPRWNTEGYAFKVGLPVGGACTSGLVPVYRAYNDGFAHGIDSNHRYALDRALLTPLVARGWKEEGIAFCVPAAAGS